MAQSHFLITGALGCLGSWVVRNLVQQDIAVTAFDLGTDPHRMKLIMTPDELAKVNFVQGDITDGAGFTDVVLDNKITNIIHLAALQVPACKANPVLGARVNVVGTTNVFEAALKAGLPRVVYASSVAVYGPPSDYPLGLISHDALLLPRTLYGVYKQANEGAAKVYFQDHGLSSIGLRPYVIYGPGRDQGMTSTPTKALLSVAAGEAYHISYGGQAGMQYVDDVSRIFIKAANADFKGADVFNIKGSVSHMRDFVGAIEVAKHEAKGSVTFEPIQLPFPDGQDDTELQKLLGEVPFTPLEKGVAQTIATFEKNLAAGLISVQA